MAKTAEERDLLWKGRKNAFGAVGRVSPSYYVQDGVVPRTQIAPTLRFIGEVGRKYGLTISNIFHAGDGNMHPIILFDRAQAGRSGAKPRRPATRFWSTASRVGGSITGEHGVGMEKNEMMAHQFTPETLEMMARFQEALRSGVPSESRQGAAHRKRLPGDPPETAGRLWNQCDRVTCQLDHPACECYKVSALIKGHAPCAPSMRTLLTRCEGDAPVQSTLKDFGQPQEGSLVRSAELIKLD